MTTAPRSSYHEDLQGVYRAGRALNWVARRRWGLRMMQRFAMRPMVGNQIDGVVNDEIFIPSTTTPEHSIRARVYKPANATGPLPAMLYIHGGGYQVGVPEQAHDFFEGLLERRDVAIVAPAYRLSLDGHPYPAGLDDCVSGVKWVVASAASLGLDPERVIVAGGDDGTLRVWDGVEKKSLFRFAPD